MGYATMECPNCGSTDLLTTQVTEYFPYGTTNNAFQATFPAMTCNSCNFGWRDHRAEESIDYAQALYRSSRGGE